MKTPKVSLIKRQNLNHVAVSQLIDLMVKNRLHTELNKAKIETLEYASVHSKDIAQNHFVVDLINPKKHFSKGAQRNF